MKHKLQLLLVDFDGVMSNGRFYHSEDKAEKEMGNQAIQNIFTPKNTNLLNDWMRGACSYGEVHDLVEQETGIDARKLDELLESSVKRMSLNVALLSFIAKLRASGVRVSLFTNNMDIFDLISRSYHNLDEYFDFIYSSSKFGQLKLENENLLQRAIKDAKAHKRDTAFVDDSQLSYIAATGYGIDTFLYSNYDASQTEFEEWLSRGFAW